GNRRMFANGGSHMKKRAKHESSSVREHATITYGTPEPHTGMLRTQIYLSKTQYDFLQSEAARRDDTMAGVIRSLIDDKMKIPEDAWTNNPMLEPTPDDPNWEGAEDSSINHDHYAYGAPKRYK